MSSGRVIGGLLALLVSLAANPLQGLERAKANSVWVAETDGAILLASSDGAIEVEITGVTNVRAAAVDIRRETVWLLGDGALGAYDLAGGLQFSIPFAAPKSVHADLVAVPSTGAVWAGAHKDLLNIGPDGQELGAFRLAAPTVRLALDETRSLLWAGTERGVEARDLVSGVVIDAVPMAPRERLQDLSVDPVTGRLWIASSDQIRLHDPDGEVLFQQSFRNATRIAAAPEGAAWIAARKGVARLNGSRQLEPFVSPLDGKGTLEHLIVAGDGTVWVANQTTIARISDDGAVLDRISFRPPARIWDLTTNTDWTPPVLEIQAPSEGACLPEATPSIDLTFSDLGWGVDPATVQVSADGQPIATTCTSAPESATCRPLEPLADGERLLGATASDYAGNESVPAERQVIIDTVAPQILVTDPPQDAVVEDPEVTVSGTVSEHADLTIAGAPVTLSQDLRFSHGPLSLDEGPNEIELVAVDCAGNTGRVTLTIVHDPGSTGLPPDPSTVASDLDLTVPTNFYDAMRFLYEGPKPVQFDLDPTVIDPTRVAVVRGSVVTRHGEPLPGVQIRVHGHPEYGHTFSREDGVFDLAVNGGARVTLEYSKPAYLPAHRPVQTSWRDFAIPEDVVLVPHDENATTVELGAPEVKVARGSVSTDEDGVRQATVIFPAGTDAELVLEDGTRQPVASLTVRATEYTVGPQGPESMPAPLPATSGYTYAVELGADEAVATGATTVAFSEPVYHYVENFLGFTVGSIVPAGYYDREQGVWVPSENGRVVEILDVVGERAVLDVDGNGEPAAPSDLDALSITDGELVRLGELYDPGTSLWRTPIPHFTPWDCNWPYGPPEDAEEPPEPDAEKPDPGDQETEEVQDDDAPAEDEEDPACEQGSVLECENQVLGEDIPLVGTSQALHYRSNRVPGRQVANAMKVRLSGRSVPASLERIDLVIDVAGRRIRRSFPPAPNQTFTFTWDRKDVYGRTLQGRHPATARVGYVYEAVYFEPAQIPSSFSAVSSGTVVTTNRDAFEVILWRSAEKLLGATDATMLGLGGWTLSDHHTYQAATFSRELHFGHGAKQVNDRLGSYQIAWNSAEDTTGLPDRRLLGPYSLVGAPDGGFYFVDHIPLGFSSPILRVWKAGPDGEKERAVFVTRRQDIPQVELGPGGDVYIATCDGFVFGKIRNLRTGETWSSFGTGCFHHFVVAPDGSFYYGRFELKRRRRDGTTTSVFEPPSLRRMGFRTIDDQGRIFVGVRATHRVWRVDPDGSARVVAGTGMPGFSGDGGPATEARLDFPQELEIAPDGSLLIVDADNHRVRRVTRSGIIQTVLGSGSTQSTAGPVAPLAAGLSRPTYLGVTPDGRILVEDGLGIAGAIFQLTYPLPRFTAVGDTTVVSKDGAELFVFDARGRHLRTLNPLTGATVRSFDYDAAGRLSSITDAFGNVTRIERDAAGAPTAIVAPFGQTTEIALGSEGYLSSVTNPGGERHRFEYSEGGLLRSLTDPEGHEKTFEYSFLGRLVQVRDEAGGTKNLQRWVSGPGRFRVELTTAEERETAYSFRRDLGGVENRSISTAGGTEARVAASRDGTHLVDLPSGTSVLTVDQADPRFELQAPLLGSRQVQLPSGLSKSTVVDREVAPSGGGNPFSFSSLSTTRTVNGRSNVEQFDAAKGELVSTSPMGRSEVAVLDQFGRPREVRSPGSRAVRYDYDDRGRLTRLIQGEGDSSRSVTLSYDPRGRLQTMADPLQRELRFEYDSADRLVKEVRPDGSVVRYSYDGNGNLTSLSPPGQPLHVFRYTSANQVATYEPPELDLGVARTTYLYDQDRRLVNVTNPDGEAVDFTYDEAGQLASVQSPEDTVRFSYDPATGLLSSIAEADTTISYAYDGSLLTTTAWRGAVEGFVKRGYDDNFWLRSRTVNGNSVTFDYDSDGLLTRAGQLTLSRDLESGRIEEMAIGSIATNATYNEFGELASLNSALGDGTLYSAVFQRDKLGRVVVKTETIEGVTRKFEYSYGPAGQLKRVTRNGTTVEEYRYDDNGNRLAATYPWGELTAVYDDQDRLLAHGGTTFTYSAAGDLATRTEGGATTTYNYDVFGNLRRVELSTGDVIEYVIDGANRRVGRKENGRLVQGFLYKDAVNPVAELDGIGTVVARFVYGARSNTPEYMIREGVVYRFITDHLGSVRLVADVETGAIVQRLDYDAFGRVIADTNPGFQPFGFAGGIYDPLTGLVRFGVRDFDPQVGRWVSKDPVGFVSTQTNLYAYVRNDPVNSLDPMGTDGAMASGIDILLLLGRQAIEGGRDFLDNYRDMRDANTIGGDKYFHCLANCEASRRGPGGEAVARGGGALREAVDFPLNIFDGLTPTESLLDCVVDEAANATGREGDSSLPCSQVCAGLRPKGLPPQF